MISPHPVVAERRARPLARGATLPTFVREI
jgi:hypothetical protein